MNGKRCALCYGSGKMTNEEFIRRARELHGNIYKYDKVGYINSNTKVIITCLMHGDFEQTPASHLKRCGCSKCGNMKTSEKLSLTNEEFIERAKHIHQNRYNYDEVCYLKNNIHVNIKCADHGEFLQNPASHLKGNGCPHCCYKQKLWFINFFKIHLLMKQ